MVGSGPFDGSRDALAIDRSRVAVRSNQRRKTATKILCPSPSQPDPKDSRKPMNATTNATPSAAEIRPYGFQRASRAKAHDFTKMAICTIRKAEMLTPAWIAPDVVSGVP